MSTNYRIISLSLEIEPVFIRRLLAHFTIQYARLHKFTACAKLLHRLRLIELLLELLESAFDVVALFDLNAEHDSLNWAPKIVNI